MFIDAQQNQDFKQNLEKNGTLALNSRCFVWLTLFDSKWFSFVFSTISFSLSLYTFCANKSTIKMHIRSMWIQCLMLIKHEVVHLLLLYGHKLNYIMRMDHNREKKICLAIHTGAMKHYIWTRWWKSIPSHKINFCGIAHRFLSISSIDFRTHRAH